MTAPTDRREAPGSRSPSLMRPTPWADEAQGPLHASGPGDGPSAPCTADPLGTIEPSRGRMGTTHRSLVPLVSRGLLVTTLLAVVALLVVTVPVVAVPVVAVPVVA